MKGKISQWKDDKGFGFIQPEDGSEKLFFHISSVKTNARRPQVGDSVLYEAVRDSQQRLKARGVVIEGVAIDLRSVTKGRSGRTEPARKGIVDYISMLVIAVSVLAAGFDFYRSNDIANAWPFGVAAALAFFVLNRQKKPKEKSFQCARCGVLAAHDARTIQAWNNGFSRLYCRVCHLQWLQDNPQQRDSPTQSRGDGCLGIMALLVLIPLLSGVALYQWLA